ncbi:hypothetical protein MHYP_G00057720 [Metynnis hypsauchen]
MSDDGQGPPARPESGCRTPPSVCHLLPGLGGGQEGSTGLLSCPPATLHKVLSSRNPDLALLLGEHGWRKPKLAFEGRHAQGRMPESVVGIFCPGGAAPRIRLPSLGLTDGHLQLPMERGQDPRNGNNRFRGGIRPWALLVQRKRPGVFRVRAVRGAATELKLLTKCRKKLASPRNRWTNRREVRHSQSTTALILTESMRRVPVDTTKPKKDIVGAWNTDFSSLMYRRFSNNSCITRLTCPTCSFRERL